MDTNATQQFKDALSQHDRVGIMVGKNPTMDDMAAALALYLSLKTAHKPATIASATQPIVELSSLVGIDEVKSSLGGGSSGDLVVSFPYQEGEIEKVSYTIENGFLNIVVKAGENGLTFTEQDVRFTRGGAGLPSLLIVVGTAQLASLSDLFNPETLKNTMIMNIDNKADNQGYGDVVLVNPQYSSVSELMGSLMLSAGLPMDVDMAQNLMNGIAYATNNFQSPQTSFHAFEMVAELMRRGAVRTPVTAQQPMPSFMQQPQSQPSQNVQMPRPAQMPRPQGMPRQPFGQQQSRGQQQPQQQQHQPRMNQRMQQPQQQQNQPRQQQNQQQSNRQEEIRRALAEQARQTRMNQPVPQPQPQQNSQPQQQSQPQNQPPMPQQQNNAPTEEAPSDWLTPKVYKGSSNIS